MSESAADRFVDRVPLGLLKRIKSSVVRVQDALVLGFTLSLIFLLRPVLDIRLAAFDTQRIGEWIQRMDLSLSLASLDDTRASRRHLHIFVLCGVQRNEHLDLMYKRHVKSLENVVLLDVRTSRWAKILRKPAMTVSLHAMLGTGWRAVYSGDNRVTLDSCGLYPNGRPFLAFSPDEEERGSRFFDLLGILRAWLSAFADPRPHIRGACAWLLQGRSVSFDEALLQALRCSRALEYFKIADRLQIA